MENDILKKSIKVKIIRIILISEILLTLVFIALYLYSFQGNLRLHSLRTISNINGMYTTILKNDVKMLSAALDTFSNNEDYKLLFQKRDRIKLYEAGKNLFIHNRDSYGITNFLFITEEGRCFLRMHQPQLADDLLKRSTVEQARATGKTASGLALGKMGFALRVAAPYTYKGSLIGYLEFGEEINHLDRIVKEEIGSDVMVLVNKGLFNEQDYRTARKNLSQSDNWDDLNKHVLVSDTLGDRQFFISKIYNEHDVSAVGAGEGGHSYLGMVTRGGRIFIRGAFPISNTGGNTIGVVMVLNDVTALIKQASVTVLSLILAAVALFAVSLWATYGFLNREIIQPLVDLSQQAVKVSMGKVDSKLESARGDEIGLLIQSFDRIRVSLKMALSMVEKK
ncbi:MAG TPA: cache domain-containing protein [Nitrospirota bacterium]|nr:cache domain-containing protein [Nitrospirota bacterium]